jgi:hypothetical protein
MGEYFRSRVELRSLVMPDLIDAHAFVACEMLAVPAGVSVSSHDYLWSARWAAQDGT